MEPDSVSPTAEPRAQISSSGVAQKPEAMKMKDFETSFSDLFAFKGTPNADPFGRNGKAGRGANEQDPLRYPTNEATDAFPAFGGEAAAAFSKASPFPAFDASAGKSREEQQSTAGEHEEGLEKAKQQANAKERRSRPEQLAKISEFPHQINDDSPAARGRKRGSVIKGLFKKGTKDEP